VRGTMQRLAQYLLLLPVTDPHLSIRDVVDRLPAAMGEPRIVDDADRHDDAVAPGDAVAETRFVTGHMIGMWPDAVAGDDALGRRAARSSGCSALRRTASAQHLSALRSTSSPGKNSSAIRTTSCIWSR
jgi:hypothetical protein